MGDNNKPTVRIGSRTIGEVSGSVKHKSNVKIEIGDNQNFDVGDTVQGNIKEGANVEYEENIEQKIATVSSQSNQERTLKDHQIPLKLKPIGDMTYIRPSGLPKQSRLYKNTGSVVICKQITGKVNNNQIYFGDGLEHSDDDDNDFFGDSSETITSNNIGSVIEVEECKEIEYTSNVTIIPKK